MIPFKISLRKVGEAGQEVEVMPETTVGEIKAQQDLKGYGFRFRGPRKDSATMADLGIKVGETIHVCKTAPSVVRQAALRLKTGECKKSNAHNHLNLHAQTQGVVVDAVMMEGDRVVNVLGGLLRGKETPRDPSQTDKERMNEILIQKRRYNNELHELRERLASQRSTAALHRAAELRAAMATIKDKATLTAQYKARLKVLNEKEKQGKAAECKTKGEAKGKAKAKAKGKAEGEAIRHAKGNPEPEDSAKQVTVPNGEVPALSQEVSKGRGKRKAEGKAKAKAKGKERGEAKRHAKGNPEPSDSATHVTATAEGVPIPPQEVSKASNLDSEETTVEAPPVPAATPEVSTDVD